MPRQIRVGPRPDVEQAAVVIFRFGAFAQREVRPSQAGQREGVIRRLNERPLLRLDGQAVLAPVQSDIAEHPVHRPRY